MPINILMPALSPTMEKGNLAKWLKKEGEKVKPGDVIAEIETDKATMEVEAVDEGTLAKIVVPEGTTDVPVNQLIAVLAGEGEDAKAAASAAAGSCTCAEGRREAPPRPRGERSLRSAQRVRRPNRPKAPEAAPSPQPSPQGRAQTERAAKQTARAAASSPRRSRVASPRKPASTLRASPAPGRMAVWSRAMSPPRRKARA